MNNKAILGIGLTITTFAIISLGVFLSKDQSNSTVTPIPTPTAVKSAPIIRDLIPSTDTPKPDLPEIEVTTEISKPDITIVNPPTTLANSDVQFLLAAADLAPQLTQWLLPQEQIRKWVLAIDLMAEGQLPKRYRPVDYPMKKFAVTSSELDTVANNENHLRMNPLITVITVITPEKMANYYQSWLPLLEKAYDEQGKNYNFNQRVNQAISQILAVNPLQQQAALIHPSVLYKFKDPALENASDIEKILWRMGPNNAEVIQNFLRELRATLSDHSST